MDAPYWVEDPDFDLEFHVRHIALPKPGDWRQLCILLPLLYAQQTTNPSQYQALPGIEANNVLLITL